LSKTTPSIDRFSAAVRAFRAITSAIRFVEPNLSVGAEFLSYTNWTESSAFDEFSSRRRIPLGKLGDVVSRFKCSVLVLDDEPAVVNLARELLSNDYEFHGAGSVEQAQEILRRTEIEIILADQELRGAHGIAFLEWVKANSPRSVRILMTGMESTETAANAINSGLAQRFLFKPWRPDQLLQLTRSTARNFLLERSHENLLDELRRLTVDLEQRVADRTRELEAANRQLQQRNSMLQKMALTDALTGLPNRRAMDRLAKNELLRRARSPSPLALALVDADFFKEINTRYLLPGGDHVLAWLGATLVNSVRTIDTVGRVGGEEFMIVAPDTNTEGAEILAERVRKTVELNGTEYKGETIHITVSVGMVVADASTLVGYDQMRHAASAALSDAKKRGRNCCVVRELPAFAGPPAPVKNA
jgi:diguanylate cyclase (GGDEF)-like protein